jgi:hypothetical protein
MSLRPRVLAILALLLPLLACSAAEPREDIEFAKHFVSLVPQHNAAEIEKEFASGTDPDALKAAIPKMIALYPSGNLKNIGVTWNEMFDATVANGSQTRVFIDLLYEFDGPGDLGVHIETTRENGKIVIQNAYFQPLPHALIAKNAFSFAGKGPLHYVVLLLAVAIPLLMLDALIKVWRSKTMRWRWAWTIFILFGFFKFTFNWTTGDFSTSFLSFQLLGIGILRSSEYQPWLVFLSVPVGALTVLYREITGRDGPSQGF